ncbi:helix-turn-helix domain-containing protein [Campylobacter jejuni]|uniref:helix-turn-helix domain-containing protein n=1 Tax=Campylobacter jejuni TaxID=197 RepID=UPI003B9B0AE4
MTAQEIKDFCKEQGLTYKQLGELIGYSESSLKSILTTGKVSENLEKSIKLLMENQVLKLKLKEMDNLKNTLKALLDLN